MPTRVKDHVEISNRTPLDTLIRYLEIIQENLPEDCEPELKMGGDDKYGRRLTVSFLRELTPDEAAQQVRVTGAVLAEPDESLEQLRAKLEDVPYSRPAKSRAAQQGG